MTCKENIKRINSFPMPLPNQTINNYFRLMQDGDEEAKQLIEIHNLRLVVHISEKFKSQAKNNISFDLDDLIDIGVIGLIKAVETYDVNKGNKFSSYCSVCITNEILMALKADNKTQKLTTSLEAPLGESDINLLEVLESDENIEVDYINSEKNEEIWEALSILSDKEKEIIMLRYGFKGKILTQKEVGNIYGYSRSYICKIEREAKRKIKEYLKERGYQVTKIITEEMAMIKKMPYKERCSYLASKMIAENLTIEQLSHRCNINIEVIKDSFNYLKETDYLLYQSVTNFIKKKIKEKRLIYD